MRGCMEWSGGGWGGMGVVEVGGGHKIEWMQVSGAGGSLWRWVEVGLYVELE